MGTRSAISEIDLKVKATIQHELDNGDITEATIAQTFLNDVLAGGIGANQANRAWVIEDVVLTSGNSDVINFTGNTPDIGSGADNDALGQVISFEEIVCFILKQTEGPGRLQMFWTGVRSYDWIVNLAMSVPEGGAMKSGSVRMWFQPDTDALPINVAPPLLTEFEFALRAIGGDVKYSIFVLARHDDEESSSSSASSSSSSSQSTSSQSTASSSSTST